MKWPFNGAGPLDEMTDANVGIDYAHAEVHERSAFMVDAVDLDMATDDTLVLAFKTPAGTKRAHLVVDFSTLVGGVLELLEGPTWTTNTGTATTIFNRFREASMKSSMLLEDKTATPAFTATDNVLLNPTNLAGGTVIKPIHAFGSQNRLANATRDVAEIPLKPDSTYALRFTAVGNSNKAQTFMDWYEHTDSTRG